MIWLGSDKQKISRRLLIRPIPSEEVIKKGETGETLQYRATWDTLWLLLNVAIVLSEWTFQPTRFLSRRIKHTTSVVEQDKNAQLAEMPFDRSAAVPKRCNCAKMSMALDHLSFLGMTELSPRWIGWILAQKLTLCIREYQAAVWAEFSSVYALWHQIFHNDQ